MFCKQCGKELKDEWEVCPYCGASVKQARDTRQTNDNTEDFEQNKEGTSGADTDDVIQEDVKPEPTFGKTGIKIRVGMKLLLLIAMVCFFCPLYLFSCAGNELFTINGLDLTLGFEYMSEDVDGILSFGALFLLPLIAFFATFIKKKFQGTEKIEALRGSGYIGAICSLATAFLALYFTAAFTENAEGTPVAVTTEPAMVILIIANLLTAVLGFYQAFSYVPLEKDGKVRSKTKTGITCALKIIAASVVVLIICLIPFETRPSTNPDDYLEETTPKTEKEEPVSLTDIDMEDMIGATKKEIKALGFDDEGKYKDGIVKVLFSDDGKVNDIVISGEANEAPSFHGVSIGMAKEDAVARLSDTYDMLVDHGEEDFICVNSKTREAAGCTLEEGMVKSIEYRTLSEDDYKEAQAAVNATYYVFPESDKRYLTEEEVRAQDPDKLLIGRNEIFARHGRMFDTQELADYFNSQPWYNGTIPASQFDDSVLNEYERANADLIKRIEDEKNGSASATSFVGLAGVYCCTTQPEDTETGRLEIVNLGNGNIQVNLGWLGGAVLLSETAQIMDSNTAQFTTYGVTVTLSWTGDNYVTLTRSGGELGDSYLDDITNSQSFTWAAEFN